MQKEIAKSPERYVQLAVIANFGKVKNLTTNMAQIIEAVEASAMLELNEDKTMVRRKEALPPAAPTRDGKRVIYADNLPAGSTAESVAELFTARGKVLSVTPCPRIGAPDPDPDAPPSTDYSSVFIEFEKKCRAKKAVQQITAFNKFVKRTDGNGSPKMSPGLFPHGSPNGPGSPNWGPNPNAQGV